MMDGLAFLPEDDVPDGMAYLRDNIPEGLEPLLQYFDQIYVSGTYRQIQLPQRPDGTMPPLRMRRKPPMYPPSIWNVHNITLHGSSRTNNICEGWNNAFSNLVGHAHPGGPSTVSGRTRHRLPLHCYVTSMVNHQSSECGTTQFSSRRSFTICVLPVMMAPSQFPIH